MALSTAGAHLCDQRQHQVLRARACREPRRRPSTAIVCGPVRRAASAWPARARPRSSRCRCRARRARRACWCGESPQTTSMPGCVRPSAGPMTCTMPCPAEPCGCRRDAELGAVAAQRLDLRPAQRVAQAAGRRSGTSWSSVASVRSGPPHRAPGGAQPVERLRAGDLVHQVQVDVQQVRLDPRHCRTTWASHSLCTACARGVMRRRPARRRRRRRRRALTPPAPACG